MAPTKTRPQKPMLAEWTSEILSLSLSHDISPPCVISGFDRASHALQFMGSQPAGSLLLMGARSTMSSQVSQGSPKGTPKGSVGAVKPSEMVQMLKPARAATSASRCLD